MAGIGRACNCAGEEESPDADPLSARGDGGEGEDDELICAVCKNAGWISINFRIFDSWRRWLLCCDESRLLEFNALAIFAPRANHRASSAMQPTAPSIERIRPRFGDIIEIPMPQGFAYAQYTHKHTDPPRFGALIRVMPGLFPSRPITFAPLLCLPPTLITFFHSAPL
jgi:hypothetical protein